MSSVQPQHRVLVIDADSGHRWNEVFERAVSSSVVEVIQCGWKDLSLTVYGWGYCMLNINDESKLSSRVVKFGKRDLVVVRNEVRTTQYDKRNVLYGFMMAGIPSINSWQSILMDLERPVSQSELLCIADRVGKQVFPVVEQYYYSDGSEMIISPDSKAMVLKMGPFHAGLGKTYLQDHHAFEEVSSLVKATTQYATCEKFIDYEYDLRLQFVNGTLRAFAKVPSHWKSNSCSGVDVTEMEITPNMKKWANLAKDIFGGLDIFSLDVLHTKDGQDFILELNGTSSGWWSKYEIESEEQIRDLCLRRLQVKH